MTTTVKSVDLVRRCLELNRDYLKRHSRNQKGSDHVEISCFLLQAFVNKGLKFPLNHMWIDYDRDADVLSFCKS